MGRHNLLEFRSWLAHAVWAALAFVVVTGSWWLVGQLSNPSVLADNGSLVYQISGCTPNWRNEQNEPYRACRLSRPAPALVVNIQSQSYWGCFTYSDLAVPPGDYSGGENRVLQDGSRENGPVSFTKDIGITGGTLTNGVEDVSCETFEGRSQPSSVSCSNVEATISSGGYAGGL